MNKFPYNLQGILLLNVYSFIFDNYFFNWRILSEFWYYCKYNTFYWTIWCFSIWLYSFATVSICCIFVVSFFSSGSETVISIRPDSGPKVNLFVSKSLLALSIFFFSTRGPLLDQIDSGLRATIFDLSKAWSEDRTNSRANEIASNI